MDNHDVHSSPQLAVKSDASIDDESATAVTRTNQGTSPVPAAAGGQQFSEFQGIDGQAVMMRSINKLESELVNLRLVYEQGLEEARLGRPHIDGYKSELRFESDSELKELDSVTQTSTPLITTATADSLGPRDFESIAQQNDMLKRICESEQSQRLETETLNDRLRQRIRRDTVSYQNQKQELLDNLHMAMGNISSLEAKVSQLSGFAAEQTSLPELLSKMREVAGEELHRYHEDSQEMIERNVKQLQSHVNDDVLRIFELSKENRQLNTTAGELTNMVQKLERQVETVNQEKEALEHLLERERRISQAYIGRLEEKLAHLRVMIVDKLRELQEARTARLPLLAELDAFHVLLGNIDDARRKAQTLQDMKSLKDAAVTIEENIQPASLTKVISEKSLVSTTGPGPITTNVVGPVSRMPSVAPVGPIKRPTSDSISSSHASLLESSTRVRSAPSASPAAVAATAKERIPAGEAPIGFCRDYFDYVFESQSNRELDRSMSGHREREEAESSKPEMISQHDYTTASSSAVGNIHIHEIHPNGLYISLINTSTTNTEEIGDYRLQQNVGGFPVAAFRFPARVRFPPGKTVTVWSGKNDSLLHQPPLDFVFSEHQFWGTGPECTTILCKPNGQAVAWMTAAHRFTPDLYQHGGEAFAQQQPQAPMMMTDLALHARGDGCMTVAVNADEPKLTQYDMNTIGGAACTAATLRREKTPQPSLLPQRHPYGVSPPTPTHPHTGLPRPMSFGNDNSSLQRQSRSQSTRPDPVPGAPYAGASAQKMGSATLRTFRPKSAGRPPKNVKIAFTSHSSSEGSRITS